MGAQRIRCSRPGPAYGIGCQSGLRETLLLTNIKGFLLSICLKQKLKEKKKAKKSETVVTVSRPIWIRYHRRLTMVKMLLTFYVEGLYNPQSSISY